MNHANNTLERSSTLRSYTKFIFKLGITLLLLVYLGLKINREEIKDTIFSIRLLPFVVSYLILLLSSIPLAIRLRILLKPTVLHLSFSRLIQIQFISQFYSLLLPSGVGMSITRWYQVTRNRLGRRVFIVITLIERAMLTVTLLLCTGIPLLFAENQAIQTFRSAILPVIFLLLIGCLLFFSIVSNPWVYNKFSLLMRRMQSRFRSNLTAKVFGIYEDCGLYIDKRQLLINAFIFHLLFQGMIFLRFYLVFISLSVNLSPITILWISMLILLILSIPISIGGIGVRETGFIWLMVLYDIEPETGAILGGMISIQFFLCVLIGAILNMRGARHSLKEARSADIDRTAAVQDTFKHQTNQTERQ